MSQVLSLNNPLQNILIKSTAKKASRYAFLYLVGIGILTLASKISIPLQPVPLTLQTLAVLMIGMVYGARLGTATVVSFVILGLVGLPILAAPLTGATIGYLIGFIPAAFVTGTLVERGWGRSVLTTALAAFLGMAIIFGCGLSWLSTMLGWQAAIAVGLTPFVLAEVVKMLVVALAVPRFWKDVCLFHKNI